VIAFAQHAPVAGALLVLAALLPQAFSGWREGLLFLLLGASPGMAIALGGFAVAMFVAAWAGIATTRDRWYARDPLVETIVRAWRRLVPEREVSRPTLMGSRGRGASVKGMRAVRRRVALGDADGLHVGLALGLALAGCLLVIYWLGADSGMKVDAVTPNVLCAVVSMLAVAISYGGAFQFRGALLSHGLMLPRSRAQFVRDVGAAMVVNHLRTVALAVLPVLAVAIAIAPEGVRPSPGTLAGLVAVTVGYHLLSVGVIAWVLRLNSPLVAALGMIPICGAGVIAILLPMAPRWRAEAWVTFGGACLLAVGGAVLMLTAYRRWVGVEPVWAGRGKAAVAF
jgi:hypothetical protein